jgi:hypothetical protein
MVDAWEKSSGDHTSQPGGPPVTSGGGSTADAGRLGAEHEWLMRPHAVVCVDDERLVAIASDPMKTNAFCKTRCYALGKPLLRIGKTFVFWLQRRAAAGRPRLRRSRLATRRCAGNQQHRQGDDHGERHQELANGEPGPHSVSIA